MGRFQEFPGLDSFLEFFFGYRDFNFSVLSIPGRYYSFLIIIRSARLSGSWK
jgi:hypothetical protein